MLDRVNSNYSAYPSPKEAYQNYKTFPKGHPATGDWFAGIDPKYETDDAKKDSMVRYLNKHIRRLVTILQYLNNPYYRETNDIITKLKGAVDIQGITKLVDGYTDVRDVIKSGSDMGAWKL
jgi:hypothetical protein